jgi:protein-S-isoprenylcysteine O-methyltransferase Ste14
MEQLQFYLGALVGSVRSPVVWVVAILVGLLLRRISLLVLGEAPTLRARYGAEYEQTCRHVRRWVPRLTAWRFR